MTVTDPEDGTINCNDVKVTFVLGHDTHGHAEQEQHRLHRLPADAGRRRRRTAATCSASSARATPTRAARAGRRSRCSTTTQVQIRQKHQEVENVVTQSGTNTATTTDPAGGGTHRGSLAAGDWLQLNGPFNLHQIDTITFRVADAAAGRTAGSPLAAIEVRQDSITGPILATANLVSTGGTAAWTSQTFPLGSAAPCPASTSCSSCSGRSRAAPPAATCST